MYEIFLVLFLGVFTMGALQYLDSFASLAIARHFYFLHDLGEVGRMHHATPTAK